MDNISCKLVVLPLLYVYDASESMCKNIVGKGLIFNLIRFEFLIYFYPTWFDFRLVRMCGKTYHTRSLRRCNTAPYNGLLLQPPLFASGSWLLLDYFPCPACLILPWFLRLARGILARAARLVSRLARGTLARPTRGTLVNVVFLCSFIQN